MCGRYSQTRAADELARRFRLDRIEVAVRKRYNAALSQEMPVVVLRDGAKLNRQAPKCRAAHTRTQPACR